MDNATKFLTISYGSGYGYGYGRGYGSGSGSGYGYGYGYGRGYGSGSGSSSGDGSGSGSGYDSGDGSGSGSGSGSGYGSGSGDVYGSGDGSGYGSGSGDVYCSGPGSGCAIKNFCGERVFAIDDTPTIIRSAHGNLAKGFVLRGDFKLIPCYIAKHDNMFAHGETIQEAVVAVNKKVLKNMDSDKVIDKFFEHFTDLSKKYPARDFFEWHHYLTGSCEMGRKAFVKNSGYDIEHDRFTVQEFIDITRNAYGKDVILRLEKVMKERLADEN